MFCPNCGTQLPDDAKFCGACGSRIAPSDVQPAQQPQAYNASIQDSFASQPQQATPAYGAAQPQVPSAPPAKKGPSKGLIAGIIAAVVVVVAALVVVIVVVKPFGGGETDSAADNAADSVASSSAAADAESAEAGADEDEPMPSASSASEAASSSSASQNRSSDPQEAYEDLLDDITSDGSFTAKVSFEIYAYDDEQEATESMQYSIQLDNYDASDLTKMTGAGSGTISATSDDGDESYSMQLKVKNGTLTEEIESASSDHTLKSGAFTNSSNLTADIWKTASFDGDQITFDLSDDEAYALIMKTMEAALPDSSGGQDSLKCDFASYSMTLDESSGNIVISGTVLGTMPGSSHGKTADAELYINIRLG